MTGQVGGIIAMIILMRSGQRDLGLMKADRSAEPPPHADLAGHGCFGIQVVIIVKPRQVALDPCPALQGPVSTSARPGRQAMKPMLRSGLGTVAVGQTQAGRASE